MSDDQSTKRLVKLLARPVAFHRVFAEVAGGVAAGLLLSQAWYWSNTATAQARDGWFYHSHSEWEDETCLSRREQYTVRKHLRERGLLAEEIRPVPGEGRVTWFRVNVEKLCEAISALPPRDGSNRIARRVEQNRPTPVNRTARPVEQNRPTPLITTETTAETTQENTHTHRAPARAPAAPPPANAGVCVDKNSRHSLEVRKAYAARNNLGGGWLTYSRDGRYDEAIEAELERLSPAAVEQARNAPPNNKRTFFEADAHIKSVLAVGARTNVSELIASLDVSDDVRARLRERHLPQPAVTSSHLQPEEVV